MLEHLTKKTWQLAHTWWSLDECKTFLKCSSDSINLTAVVAVQQYVGIDSNIVSVRLRKCYVTFKKHTHLLSITSFNTRKSAVGLSGTAGAPAPRMCKFWFLVKVNRTICSGVTTNKRRHHFCILKCKTQCPGHTPSLLKS